MAPSIDTSLRASKMESTMSPIAMSPLHLSNSLQDSPRMDKTLGEFSTLPQHYDGSYKPARMGLRRVLEAGRMRCGPSMPCITVRRLCQSSDQVLQHATRVGYLNRNTLTWLWVYHFGVGAPPILEPILVVGLGCSHGVGAFAFDPWPHLDQSKLG